MKHKLLSVFVVMSMLLSLFSSTVFALKVEQEYAPKSSFITSPVAASGADYSSNSKMISKLNSIFSGNVGITTSSGASVNAALGTSNVPDNKVTLYACNRLVSGTSCWIYGNAVYYTLFADVVADGQMTYYCYNSEKINGGITSASYDVFKNAGVRQAVGAYIRTTTHTVIVLSYSTSGISIIEGNADGDGLIRISNYSWAEFNNSILKNGNKPIQYIVQPTDEYYEATYPSCVHSYKGEGICSKCGYVFPWQDTKDTSYVGTYTVTLSGGTYPRTTAPYSDAAKSSTLFPKGAKINVSYGVTNAYNNVWYYATYGGVSGFVNEDNVQLESRPTQQFTCLISSPAEGAVVPKSAYPVIGTLTSAYYQIKEVKAYIDGSCYATVSNVNATSLELRPTAVNQKLDFAGLSSGKHVLRIDARDSQSSSFVTVINRTFYTETQSAPTNAKVVTDKSTYTLGEVVTITPTASGASGYNVSVWLGAFGSGEQVYGNYDEFTGSVSFKPSKAGSYTVRASCINSAGYVNTECTFTVTDPVVKITISFDTNGGSCSVSQKTIVVGSAIGDLPTPTKTGYDFAGWYFSGSYGAYVPISKTTTFSKATTVYAKWANRVYDGYFLRFVSQGEQLTAGRAYYKISDFNTQRHENDLIVYNCGGEIVYTNKYGSEVVVDENGKVLQKKGYGDETHFTVPEGGFILSGHGKADTFVSGNISVGDYVAYSTYSGNAWVYDTQDEYLYDWKAINTGEPFGVLPKIERDDYDFAGWFRKDEYGAFDAVTSEMISDGEKALYAKWSTDVYSGNFLTFISNGEQLTAERATYKINGFNTQRRENDLIVYNCSGEVVYTNKYGSEVVVDATGRVIQKKGFGDESHFTVPEVGFVLSGNTKANTFVYNNIYVGDYVAYSTDSGNALVYDTQDEYLYDWKVVTVGEPIGVLPTPKRDGCTFLGWYTAASGGKKVDESTIYNGEKKLYAIWSDSKFDVDLNAYIDGKIVENTKGYGTADVYINGKLVANDVTDYCTEWPVGTTYEFKDIKPAEGYSYLGIHEGSVRKGVITSGRGAVAFNFAKFDTNSVTETGEEYYHNGHRYLYFQTTLTWHEAKEYCKAIGGHLVTINNSAENSFVRSLFDEGKRVWIGASDENEESVWEWVTGEPFEYTSWSGSEPNNTECKSNDGEDFAHFTADGNWNDVNGNETYAFICEFKDCRHSYLNEVTEPTCTERGYTIYVCQYCEHTYKDNYVEAIGHDYLYSYDGDYHAAICSNCSDYFTEEHSFVDGVCVCRLDGDVIINHSLNLASDISINYVVRADLLLDYDSLLLEVQIPQYSENELIESKVVTLEPMLNGDYYYFTMKDITAVQMNDILVATLRMKKGDQEYFSKRDGYSVATYALNQLNKTGVTEQLKTLCADLIRYGATAQTFKGYRADVLATDGMTAEHSAWLSDINAVTFGNTNTIYNDISSPLITWVGKTLNLDSKVIVKFVFDAAAYTGNIANLTLKLVYEDSDGIYQEVTLKNPSVYNAGRRQYAFDFDGLMAAELRTAISAAVYVGDMQVSQTLRYSPDAYGNNKTGALLTVCKALFAYSDSAKAYFAN